MVDNKKYYYLKLKDNFFETEEIKLLESLENGYLYSNILLKIYLKSLKNEGRLVFRENIPYNAKMLASIIGINEDIIEKSIKVFQQFGLITLLESGEIYISDIQSYIGSTSTEADRIRGYRNKINKENQNVIETRTNSVQMYDKCTPEIEKELEIEIERDNSSSSAVADYPQKAHVDICPYEKIRDIYHKHCVPPLPECMALSSTRKVHIKSFWRQAFPKLEDWEDYFTKVKNSDFLMGKTTSRDREPFRCTLDWLLKMSNMIKVMEGNYDNQRG